MCSTAVKFFDNNLLCHTEEANKSSNDGNSADTEGEGESEIGEIKSPDIDKTVKFHNQPVRLQDGHRKHDPNR